MFKRTRARVITNKSKGANLKSSPHDYYENQNKLYSAQQSFDRYTTLARDALTMGDRVIAEGYYQHAEHYLRLINGSRQPAPMPVATPFSASESIANSQSENTSKEKATDNSAHLGENHITALILKDLESCSQ